MVIYPKSIKCCIFVFLNTKTQRINYTFSFNFVTFSLANQNTPDSSKDCPSFVDVIECFAHQNNSQSHCKRRHAAQAVLQTKQTSQCVWCSLAFQLNSTYCVKVGQMKLELLHCQKVCWSFFQMEFVWSYFFQTLQFPSTEQTHAGFQTQN